MHLPKISKTLWYVVTFGDQWAALLIFSAAALKCSARDCWIGWDFRHQYDRLKLVAKGLGQKVRQRFGCRYQYKRYIVPSLSTIRDVLIRVNPVHLDRALQRWNQAYGQHDESLAIDGKTMCNAIDDQGYQTHIMNAVGHQSKTCYTLNN